jgi:hypothetical protein
MATISGFFNRKQQWFRYRIIHSNGTHITPILCLDDTYRGSDLTYFTADKTSPNDIFVFNALNIVHRQNIICAEKLPVDILHIWNYLYFFTITDLIKYALFILIIYVCIYFNMLIAYQI